MKKTITTRMTALTAALALIAGSAASCGKTDENKNNAKVKTTQELMSGSYKAVEIITDVDNIQRVDKINDEKMLISSYSYDSGAPTFYLSDSEFENIEPLEIDFGIEPDDEVYFNTSISSDGDIVAMATFTDYGDVEKPDFEDPDFDYENFDFEEFYSHVTESYKLYTVDIDGTVKSKVDITGLDEYLGDEDNRGGMGGMYPCSDGKVLCEVYSMENTIVIIGPDGKVEGELDGLDANYLDSVAVIDDATIALGGYFKNYKNLVKYVDAKTLKPTGDEIDLEKAGISNGVGTLFKGNGDYKVLVSASDALYGIKEDGSSVEIVNWLDSDLGNGGVNSIIALENGDYIVAYQDYMSGGSTLYRLTKRDTSELDNIKVLTIGVMYDNWDVKQKVSDFNKSHDDVRFKMVDYSKYDQYDEENNKRLSSGDEQLKKDILSGNAPDMIVCQNQAIIKNLAKKGLFVDLNEFLEKDSEFNVDDIMPNILEACKINGKLLSLPSSFNIQTYAIKSKNFDKEGWTVDEMIDTYKSMPEGTSLTELDCKEMIAQMLLSSMCKCIDYDKGTCSFDSPDFKTLLSFCEQFPKEEDIIDWEDQDAVMEIYNSDNFMKDKQLITPIYFYDFDYYISQCKGRFGDEPVTFVGYPSVGGNGAVMQLSESIAILTNATDQQSCWEITKEFFKEPSEEDEEQGRYYSNGLPTRKSAFDKAAEAATKKPYYIDENGKKVEYEYNYYDQATQKSIDVAPLTEEEKNEVVDYIMNTTTIVDDFDPEIQDIIMEEAEAFFEGEKTSDEIIANLQSRISLLLSEQS